MTGRLSGEINYPTPDEGTPIVDDHNHFTPIVEVGHFQFCSKRKSPVGTSHGVGVETNPTGRPPALKTRPIPRRFTFFQNLTGNNGFLNLT